MTDKTEIWQATEAFVGDGMMIQVGDTVAAGHPILKGRKAFFAPFTPMYDHERDQAARDAALEETNAAKAAAEAEAVAAQEAATVKDILESVAGDPAKATVALEAEKAGKNRVTLVEALEEIVAAETPAGEEAAPAESEQPGEGG